MFAVVERSLTQAWRFFDNATVGTKLYTTPQQSQPLTDEQYLELLLRTGSKELLHYTAFVNDTLQGRGQMQLLKSAKDIRDFVEAAHGIKKGGVAAKKEN